MPIRDEAINVFMGLPGDGARLELTYNHGVDSYELGTGYNHIAVTVDDIDGTLGQPVREGHRSRETALHRAGRRPAPVLRPRPRRLSHRADRALLAEERRTAVIDLGSNTFRLVVFTAVPEMWWKRTDEIYDRVRLARRRRRGRRARARGDRARGPDRRALRALLLGARRSTTCARSPPARSATPPTRTRSSPACPSAATSACAVLAPDEEARYGYLAAVNSTTLARRRGAGPRRRLAAARARRARATRRRRAPGRSAPCA